MLTQPKLFAIALKAMLWEKKEKKNETLEHFLAMSKPNVTIVVGMY